MTDSHFHSLAMAAKGLDPAAEVNAAFGAGVTEVIEVGLHPQDLAERIDLFADVSNVFFTSGLAPAEAAKDKWKSEIGTLRRQTEDHDLIAVGEIGLDWHWNYGTKDGQIELMASQMEIAKDADLPVVIHNREADGEVLEVIKSADLPRRGVMHCFSSGYRFASKCIDLGYKISFAGNVTYKNALEIQDTARKIPSDSILAETDAPFLSPQAVRGKPNTPAHIGHTYEFLAQLRNTSPQELAAEVRLNLYQLFRFNS